MKIEIFKKIQMVIRTTCGERWAKNVRSISNELTKGEVGFILSSDEAEVFVDVDIFNPGKVCGLGDLDRSLWDSL